MSVYLPNASCDGTGVVYSNELIGSGSYVEVRLFFVYKKCVRYPNVFDEFRSHGEGFHPFFLVEGKAGVRPKLAKVEIQGEVLLNHANVSVRR